MVCHQLVLTALITYPNLDEATNGPKTGNNITSPPVAKSQPIILNFSPIMLLSNAQKVELPFMLNTMPMTTAIMLQFIYNFIIFNNYS